MNRKIWKLAVVSALLMAASTTSVSAQNKKDKTAAEPTISDTAAAPSEQDAKMAEMQKLTAPGENHRRLDALVGNWKHTVKWWMTPKEKMQKSEGTTENKWILNGRFLKQHATGTAMGQPFEGIGVMGYDNIREEYTSIWMDNMGTGIMSATGQFDPAKKAISESGTYACPMTGEKDKAFRSALKITSKDSHTYTMWTTDKDGKEFKMMEITYTRVK